MKHKLDEQLLKRIANVNLLSTDDLQEWIQRETEQKIKITRDVFGTIYCKTTEEPKCMVLLGVGTKGVTVLQENEEKLLVEPFGFQEEEGVGRVVYQDRKAVGIIRRDEKEKTLYLEQPYKESAPVGAVLQMENQLLIGDSKAYSPAIEGIFACYFAIQILKHGIENKKDLQVALILERATSDGRYIEAIKENQPDATLFIGGCEKGFEPKTGCGIVVKDGNYVINEKFYSAWKETMEASEKETYAFLGKRSKLAEALSLEQKNGRFAGIYYKVQHQKSCMPAVSLNDAEKTLNLLLKSIDVL